LPQSLNLDLSLNLKREMKKKTENIKRKGKRNLLGRLTRFRPSSGRCPRGPLLRFTTRARQLPGGAAMSVTHSSRARASAGADTRVPPVSLYRAHAVLLAGSRGPCASQTNAWLLWAVSMTRGTASSDPSSTDREILAEPSPPEDVAPPMGPAPSRACCGFPPLLLLEYKSRHLDHFVIREL
jgi:hypothetical protein